MLLAAFFSYEIFQNVLTGVNFLFMSDKDLNALKEKIIGDQLIPEGYKIEDALPDEVLLTAWDINSRTPRFFSKWSDKN